MAQETKMLMFALALLPIATIGCGVEVEEATLENESSIEVAQVSQASCVPKVTQITQFPASAHLKQQLWFTIYGCLPDTVTMWMANCTGMGRIAYYSYGEADFVCTPGNNSTGWQQVHIKDRPNGALIAPTQWVYVYP